MAQSLIDISMVGLRLQLPSFDDRSLIKTYTDLSQWIRNNGDKVGKSISESKYSELERKRTIILKEMHSRGLFFDSGFKDWMNKVNTQLKRG